MPTSAPGEAFDFRYGIAQIIAKETRRGARRAISV